MHIKFKGDGSAEIVGIPARDLDKDEWNALAPEQQAHALASGLYEQAAPVAAPRVSKKDNSPVPGNEGN